MAERGWGWTGKRSHDPAPTTVSNDLFHASESNPAGYAGGMWIFTVLASLGLFFSYMLWRTERRPGAHGLETITTKTGV